MTSLVLLQIFFRYIIKAPLTWSEEAARFSMIWLIMLASITVLRKNKHLSVTFFAELAHPTIQRWLRVCVHLLSAIFLFVLLFHGYELSMNSMSQKAAATGIPMGFIAGSIPVFGLIGLLFTVENIVKELSNKTSLKE